MTIPTSKEAGARDVKKEGLTGLDRLRLFEADARTFEFSRHDAVEAVSEIETILDIRDDLLAALKKMLPEANAVDEHCRPSFEACEEARNAIAKAEGTTP